MSAALVLIGAWALWCFVDELVKTVLILFRRK